MTYTLLPKLETLQSHAVFTPMRISWPGIAIRKRSGPHVSQKWKARVCTKMKSKRTMKYHEKPRHYFMAVAALINQGFKTCFLVFQLFFFACGQNLHLLVQGNHIWATLHLVSKITWLSHIIASGACSERRIIVVAVVAGVVHSIRLIGIAFMLQKSIFCIWCLTIPVL